ncbi:hypothetical protein CHS0354_023596 [Potamilus streckersoni]|uniref:Uncharacterized protein n=1 Tax=Potamilus streckersoni TaxID=2493646 RepID=A0AAE0VZA5_9BIVA|nr:hypothetical protein CHS0354_023596 [Potamilus streckersoni]
MTDWPKFLAPCNRCINRCQSVTAASRSQPRNHAVLVQAVEMAMSALLGDTLIGTGTLCTPVNILSQSRFVSTSTHITAAIPIKVKPLILEGRYIDLSMFLPDRCEKTFKMLLRKLN